MILHDADLLPTAAVMVAVPSETAVTTPFFTVAIVSSEEVQVISLLSVDFYKLLHLKLQFRYFFRMISGYFVSSSALSGWLPVFLPDKFRILR